jgi:Flp pilus assembly pilin Flp
MSGIGFDEKLVRRFGALVADLRCLLARTAREESGQGLTEYALILIFIAVVAVAALTFLGSDISSLLSHIGNSF